MKVNVNVVAWILFVNVLSVRISSQEKPEDCVPGKEFWSTFFHSKGTCAACPRYLENCDDQGPDKEACEKSCAKKVSSSVLSSSTSTTSDLTSQLPVVTSISSTAMTVASSKALRPGKPTKYKDIHDDDKPHFWIILVVLLAAALVFGSILIVLLLVRKCRKNMQRNMFGLYPLRRPIQAFPSEIKIGGIQDTAGKQQSAIHLDETNS